MIAVIQGAYNEMYEVTCNVRQLRGYPWFKSPLRKFDIQHGKCGNTTPVS